MRANSDRTILLHCIALGLIVLSSLATGVHAKVQVVDGDTIKIDRVSYRLHGIDTPERDQYCGNWACGQAATAAMKALITGRQITCKPTGDSTYGRPVATCFADDINLGQALVERGLAWAYTSYSHAYVAHEAAARSKRLGIWSGPYAYQPAWEYRQSKRDAGLLAASKQQPPDPNCPIKGNISKNGKIYHTPGSRWYSRTKIDRTKGERWFCSEQQAKRAGWRAPYR